MSRARRLATFALVAGAGLFAFYRWQPQRVTFHSAEPLLEPEPTDADVAHLFSSKSRVAVVTAHPDDAEFYLGGTLTRLHEHRSHIRLVVTTDGDKGYYPFENAERNRILRRSEQLRSAARFGCQDVSFLGNRDGRLKAGEALENQIVEALASWKPDYVMTFDPRYPPKVQHSDHLRTGESTYRAVSRLPTVKWILGFSTHAPNFAVDITDAWPEKRRLLAVHESQFSGNRLQMIERLLRSGAVSNGRLVGVPLAETFRATRVIM